MLQVILKIVYHHHYHRISYFLASAAKYSPTWDVLINRIRLGVLICSLKSFLQLSMCQELQIFAAVYMYSSAG